MDVTGHETDRHRWRAAILLGLAVTAGGMLYSMVAAPAWLGLHQWRIALDTWVPVPAAAYVSNGAFPFLYEANPFFVAMPLLPVVLAPVAALGQYLHLSQSYPQPLPYPTLWWALGPYGMSTGILVLYGARRLAVAVGIRRRLVALQASLAVVGLVTPDVLWGHFEDVLALGFLLVAAAVAIEGRAVRAALLLGLAIACKQWALLALPCFVAVAPRGVRVRTTLATLALPAALAGITLAADWGATSRALFDAPVFPRSGGHLAPWITSRAPVIVGTPGRAVAVAVALAVGWWIRNRNDPATLVAALAVALLTRLLFEPLVLAYYLSPAIVLLAVYEHGTTGRHWRSLAFGVLLLWLFPLHPNPPAWWAAALATTAVIAYPAVRGLVSRLSAPSAPRTASTAGPAARATAPTAPR